MSETLKRAGYLIVTMAFGYDGDLDQLASSQEFSLTNTDSTRPEVTARAIIKAISIISNSYDYLLL